MCSTQLLRITFEPHLEAWQEIPRYLFASPSYSEMERPIESEGFMFDTKINLLFLDNQLPNYWPRSVSKFNQCYNRCNDTCITDDNYTFDVFFAVMGRILSDLDASKMWNHYFTSANFNKQKSNISYKNVLTFALQFIIDSTVISCSFLSED